MIFRTLMRVAWLRRAVTALLGRNKTIYVGDRGEEYRALWSTAAMAIGADLISIAPDVWEVRYGDRRTRISNSLVEFDDAVVLDLAGDKTYGYDVARGLGVPTPTPRTFTRGELDQAWRRIPLAGGPYVIKPAKGTGAGVGVSVGVRSRISIASALALASTYSLRVIVERLVAAETIRLLFLDGIMIHAIRRRGVRVVGDGASTISELLARSEPRPVPIDGFVRETLAQQGRSLEDVPPVGAEIVARWLPADVRSRRELRTVYDEDVSHLVASELIEEVAAVLAGVGSRFAGIDVLTNDPTRSLAESGGVFLEVNATPGLHHHCSSSKPGASCGVAEVILRRLLGLEVV